MYFFKRFTLPQGRKFSFSKDICITKPHQSFRFLDKTKKDLKKVFLFLYNYVLTFYTAHCRASCFPLRSIFACRVSSYVTHLTCVLLHSPTISSSGTYATHLTCELLQQIYTIVRDACTDFMYRVCTLPRVKLLPESRITPTCSV